MLSQEIDELLENVRGGRVRDLLRNVLSLPEELIKSIIDQSDQLFKSHRRAIRLNMGLWQTRDIHNRILANRDGTLHIPFYGPGF